MAKGAENTVIAPAEGRSGKFRVRVKRRGKPVCYK
jgi:hypothetical protein